MVAYSSLLLFMLYITNNAGRHVRTCGVDPLERNGHALLRSQEGGDEELSVRDARV